MRRYSTSGKPRVTSLFALGRTRLNESAREGRSLRIPPLIQPKWVEDRRRSDRFRESMWLRERVTHLPLEGGISAVARASARQSRSKPALFGPIGPN